MTKFFLNLFCTIRSFSSKLHMLEGAACLLDATHLMSHKKLIQQLVKTNPAFSFYSSMACRMARTVSTDVSHHAYSSLPSPPIDT